MNAKQAIIGSVLFFSTLAVIAFAVRQPSTISEEEINAQVEEIGELSDQEEQTDAMLALLNQINQQNKQQMSVLMEGQASLISSISTLEQRIEELENSGGDASSKKSNSSHSGKQAVSSNNEKTEAMSEAQFGEWMESSIEFDYHDVEATEWATSQALDSLGNAPGVALDDMRCGEGFCRAQFSAEQAGESVEIGELFGHPPFMSEGFSVVQADGSVLLYFTEEGVSIEELRNRAKESYQYN